MKSERRIIIESISISFAIVAILAALLTLCGCTAPTVAKADDATQEPQPPVDQPPQPPAYLPVQYISGPLTFVSAAAGSRQPTAVYDTGDGWRIDFTDAGYHLDNSTGFHDWPTSGTWTRIRPVVRDQPTAPTWTTLAVDFDANTQTFTISMPDGAASTFTITGPYALPPNPAGNG